MRPELRSPSIGRAAVGVLSAALASLAALPAVLLLATAGAPDEGDSWVRGAIGLILIAPAFAGFLVGYYAVAALVTYVCRRWRRAVLVGLAVVTVGGFATWAASRSDRGDVLALVSSLLLADLLFGSWILYRVYARRLTNGS